MNKLEKFLSKLDNDKRAFLLELSSRIRAGDLHGLNIKKLKGSSSAYRLKKGSFRIIYTKEGSDIDVISIDRRSEKTYKDF